jgi:hypothetical protein
MWRGCERHLTGRISRVPHALKVAVMDEGERQAARPCGAGEQQGGDQAMTGLQVAGLHRRVSEGRTHAT